MSDNRDDDTAPHRQGPADEGDSRTGTARSDAVSSNAVKSKEPLVSGDPLGLGGTTEPDAPSRDPRPKIAALLGEFFKMSRTTAILLVAFVLLSVLYAVVKDEPVVGIGPPAPAPDQTSEITPSETSPSEATSTDGTSSPETSTDDTTVGETTAPTAPPQTSTPQTGPTQTQNRQVPTGVPNRTDQQAPQGTAQEQVPPQQAPGNGGAGNGGAGAGQEPATTG